MTIGLVVFDIAGTTVVDRGNINEAFRYAFSNAGYKVAPEDVDTVMGYRKIDAIKIILDQYGISPDIATNLSEIIHNDFTANMVRFYLEDQDLQALPFAEEVFEQLQNRDIKVALNTGFTRVITNAILDRLGWRRSELINVVVCSDEVPEGRPHPYMIKDIMEQLNMDDSQKVAKIGDTKVDIEEGRNANCGLVVAVTTGAYTREELMKYQPDHIIDSLQQLPALIK
jgi:phosphonatase-like hydrolase